MFPRLLMLTHRTPYPPDRGDRIRSFHLLRELAAHFDVSLACVTDEPTTDEQRRILAGLTRQLAIESVQPLARRMRGGFALITGQPVTPAMFFNRRLMNAVQRWHRDKPFDAVLTFCTGMTRYAAPIVADASIRHVLDLVDVDSVKWRSYASQSRPPMRWVYAAEARRLRRLEAGRGIRFDAVTVISDAEKRVYEQTVRPEPRLHVVGNGVDLNAFHPLPDAGSEVATFVGVLDYKPNVDGAVWFARHVLPLIRQHRPQATFRIVGRRPTAGVHALAGLPGVEVVGPVNDVRDELARAAVVVAPLRLARGVQNKVLEAMAAQRAVVCTSAAAEGIDAVAGEHLRVADEPEPFASDVVMLLADSARRQQLAVAGRSRVTERYDWTAAVKPMAELLRPRETPR